MVQRYPYTRGPDGKNICRYCHGTVPRPRIYWCSAACVDAAYLRCDPKVQRRKVEERDHGVCAVCGLDTGAVQEAYNRALNAVGLAAGRYSEPHKAVAERMRALRIASSQGKHWAWDIGHLWEMDHIVPVIEGGDEIDDVLSNLRTLCIPCHKRATKDLAGRRARERHYPQGPSEDATKRAARP